MGIQITVIGAGSSYTPELVATLNQAPDHPEVDRLVLMDPDKSRAAAIAGVCERLAQAAGSPLKIHWTTDRQEALTGADYVLLQIRVGGLAARVRDETLPMALGMVGNETTGAGGFVCGLRTVAAALEIAADIERYAPEAWVLNLANPAGIVTEALLTRTRVKAAGFCNIPINNTYALARVLGVDPGRVRLDMVGLNHLGWIRAVEVDGEDRLGGLIAQTRSQADTLYQQGIVDPLVEPDFLQALGMIPTWYVRYFYFPERTLAEDQSEPATKGDRDRQAETRLAELYRTAGFGEEARRILAAKGGSQYYLPVLQAIDSIENDRGDVIIADVLNGSTFSELPADACIETPVRFCRRGLEPLPASPLPEQVRGLVQAVKSYEQLTIRAAETGDRLVALLALMVNPLVGSYDRAKAFFNRVLENEQAYLPQFYR